MNPKHVVNWNFAHKSWHCPKAEADFELQGKFSYRMEAKDGSLGFDYWGHYEEIVPLEFIKTVLGDEREVFVEFIAIDNGTKVEQMVEPETSNPVEMQISGWQAILNQFKAYSEAHCR